MPDQYGSIEEVRIRMLRADRNWGPAVEAFDSYEDRLRRLADGAEQQRKAMLFAELCNAPWEPAEHDPTFSLAENLEPGHRPGPPAIWGDFDKAVKALGRAVSGDGYATLAVAFGHLSKAATALADQLSASDGPQELRQQTA